MSWESASVSFTLMWLSVQRSDYQYVLYMYMYIHVYVHVTKLPDFYYVNCVVSRVQEVDERFLLVLTEDFVILAVGMSLSGYEMKVTVL